MYSIISKNLSKTFQKKGKRKYFVGRKLSEDELIRAVDNVSLRVKRGELFGLLGPNGAGKTTLVKCLSTLLLPNSGTAQIEGYDIVEEAVQARKLLGVTTGGERTLYWKLSARDNLKYFASLYGIPSKKAQQRIDELLDLMKLSDRKNERIEKFSTGMRQKVSIARAILHDPKVLLLDEPTLGLDPSFSRFLRNFIKEELNKKEGKTILLTTHYMEEADQLCDRIAFINEGRIVACDTPENLKKSIPQEEVLELECLGALSNDWRKVEGVSNLYTREEKGICVLRLQAENTEDVMSDVIDEVRKQAKILSVKVSKPTLEDVFIHLTGSKLMEGGQDESRA